MKKQVHMDFPGTFLPARIGSAADEAMRSVLAADRRSRLKRAKASR